VEGERVTASSGSIDLGITHLDDVLVIGRGGFSVVYAATDTRFHRRVAVKVLGQLVDESDRRRFDRECQIMGRLSSHPNVVTVYDAGFTPDQRPYLIMELIEGGSLANQLQREGPVPWERAVACMISVCDALDQAHQEGILHRDIKPENILLNRDSPLLTDFGIAHMRDATGSASTNVSASLLHAPPETFDNARDERSDLYSLTSTLYTLVAGRPPFARADDESLSPIILRILHEQPPALGVDLAPPSLDDLIRRGLSKDPGGRPQSARDLRDRLKRISDDPTAGGGYETVVASPLQSSMPLNDYLLPSARVPASEPPSRLVVSSYLPPGWYHALGDPPVTTRYWVGVQWVGGPQRGQQSSSAPASTIDGLASYGQRFGAFLIDLVFLIAVLIGVTVLSVIAEAITSGAGEAVTSATWVPFLAFVLWNSCIKQGRSGQTLGKQMLHLRLVSDRTARPPGIGVAFVRLVFGWMLAIFTCFVVFPLLNWLWPLWDSGNKRLTDRALGLSVTNGTTA
jgi:serine/threonine protein kinase/uncharacterized RDD family membrane protein YckC